MGDWLNRQLGGATFTPASKLPQVERIVLPQSAGRDYLTYVGDPNEGPSEIGSLEDKLLEIAALYKDDEGPLDPTPEEEGLYSFEGNKLKKILSEVAGKGGLKPEIPKPISGDLPGFARMPGGDVGYRATQSPYEIPQEMLGVKDLRNLVNQLLKQQMQASIVQRPRQRLSTLI